MVVSLRLYKYITSLRITIEWEPMDETLMHKCRKIQCVKSRSTLLCFLVLAPMDIVIHGSIILEVSRFIVQNLASLHHFPRLHIKFM